MDAQLFAADLLAKPEYLTRLADSLASSNPWTEVLADRARIIFVGMGSSHFAAGVAAARLRAKGGLSIAELASSELLPQPRPTDLIVAVSAGGHSVETRSAIDFYRGTARVVLLTNTPDSELATEVDHVIDVAAGRETGGVACRSFQHTQALLLALEDAVVGLGRPLPELIRAAARATHGITESRGEWLPVLTPLLDGPDGLHVVAPARRFSSAQQSALMLREGPRRVAHASETGDWSHIDVYLTKTTDYRMLLLGGSRWEPELLRWTTERRSTVVSVGTEIEGATATLHYEGDDDDDVRLLSETTVAELLAAHLWSGAAT